MLTNILEQKLPQKNIQVAAEKKQLKHLGQFKLHKGHNLYLWKNGKAEKATPENSEYKKIAAQNTSGKIQEKSVLVIDKEAVYVSALNIKNAKKKFVKLGLEVK